MKQCSQAGQSMRLRHLARFLAEFDPNRGPVDLAWRAYAKKNPVLGAKDRSWIAERIFLHEKRRSLFEALAPEDWVQRAEDLALWPDIDPQRLAAFSEAQLLGMPEPLWEAACAALGEEKARGLGECGLTEAPLFLRVNSLQSTREQLMEKLQQRGLEPQLCRHSALGVRLPPRSAVTRLPEYQAGDFEIQDEGSQLVAALCRAKPGDEVLDYCAGAGGKSLAIACAMQGKGQIFLHDIREKALAEAKLRLRRAGVQNAQVVQPQAKVLKGLLGRCDWVFVDVPCSGTGTLRRNPDMKWRFRSSELDHLVQLQREIALKAAAFVKPSGKLVYATCSVLPQENQQQRAWLEKQGWRCVEEWSSFPVEGEMDGLYGAVFERNRGREGDKP
jgi:16S rRNA (cytosine967-C5)-methyltransferase